MPHFRSRPHPAYSAAKPHRILSMTPTDPDRWARVEHHKDNVQDMKEVEREMWEVKQRGVKNRIYLLQK